MTPRRPRPPALDDPVWLAQQLRTKGTMTIALELGVSRGMVRGACDRHLLESYPEGPRRGVTATTVPIPPPVLDLSPIEQAIIDRIRLWRARMVPATEGTLNAAIAGAHGALAAGEDYAYDAALIDIAAASALVYEHRQKVRRAA